MSGEVLSFRSAKDIVRQKKGEVRATVKETGGIQTGKTGIVSFITGETSATVAVKFPDRRKLMYYWPHDLIFSLASDAKEFFSMDRVTVEGTVLRTVDAGVVVKFDDGSINTFGVEHVTLASRPEVEPEPADHTYVIRIFKRRGSADVVYKSDSSVWIRDDKRAEALDADMTIRFPTRWWRAGSLGDPLPWDQVSRGYEVKVIDGA